MYGIKCSVCKLLATNALDYKYDQWNDLQVWSVHSTFPWFDAFILLTYVLMLTELLMFFLQACWHFHYSCSYIILLWYIQRGLVVIARDRHPKAPSPRITGYWKFFCWVKITLKMCVTQGHQALLVLPQSSQRYPNSWDEKHFLRHDDRTQQHVIS